jgi:hypothetical protein
MTDETPPSNVTDISKFRSKKTERVLECKCGSQLFYLHYCEPGLTGRIQCRLCDSFYTDKCWGYRE